MVLCVDLLLLFIFFSIAERGSDLHMAGLAKSHGVTVLFTNAIKVLSGQLGAFEVDPSWKECGVQDIIENSILCHDTASVLLVFLFLEEIPSRL